MLDQSPAGPKPELLASAETKSLSYRVANIVYVTDNALESRCQPQQRERERERERVTRRCGWLTDDLGVDLPALLVRVAHRVLVPRK